MGIKNLFGGQYNNTRILITGHTGFKGSWLTLWLNKLGASVLGYSLNIPTSPSHYEILKLHKNIKHLTGDVRDKDYLLKAFEQFKPNLVFHLAAQSLVRYSYHNPIETLGTNVMGTANVLECCRLMESVKGIVNVTSDKCYENREDGRHYIENDRMGGYDIYSASKGCAELIANSYRKSFFNFTEFGNTHNMILASVRAGNVIGGGDWSQDRLIPDLIKSTSNNSEVLIRSPNSIRPWQHVIDPLSGYLLLGQKILENYSEISDAWNIGPNEENSLTVKQVVNIACGAWNEIKFTEKSSASNVHEAITLQLDTSKVREKLNWEPVWKVDKAIIKAIDWYKSYYLDGFIKTEQNLEDYISDAHSKNLIWVK